MSAPLEQESLGGLLGRAGADAKAFAQAEVKVVTARTVARLRAVQTAAILSVTAALFFFATLVALLVGLILVISGMPGSGWGTLAVVLGGLLVTGLLGWLGVIGFKHGLKAGGK